MRDRVRYPVLPELQLNDEHTSDLQALQADQPDGKGTAHQEWHVQSESGARCFKLAQPSNASSARARL